MKRPNQLLLLFFLTSLFLLGRFGVQAQVENSNWFVPDSACFKIDELYFLKKFDCVGVNMRQEAISCMSDEESNLLYYTFSEFSELDPMKSKTKIFRNDGKLIDNAFDIDMFLSATNGAVSIKTKKGYYTLYVNNNLSLSKLFIKNTLELHYKNVFISNDSLTEKVSAIKHGNGLDWWIISHKLNSDSFLIHLYKESIDEFIFWSYQKIGYKFNSTGLFQSFGEVAVESNGNRFAYVDFSGIINLYDFDRCNGNILKFMDLSYLPNKYLNSFELKDHFYGCSFSPSGQFLYVSSGAQSIIKRFYQIDLWNLSDTINSIHLLDSLFFPSQMELYNNKIIINESYAKNGYIGIINEPNTKGLGCGLTRQYQKIFINGAIGLPNFACFAPPLMGLPNSAGRDTTVAPGRLVILGLPPQQNMKYEWESDPPNAYMSCRNCPRPVVAPDTTTKYFLTLTDTTFDEHSDCNFGFYKVRVKVEKPVSLEPESDTPKFTVYPNPTQGNFTIKHPVAAVLTIQNPLGQTIFTQNLTSAGETLVSTDGFPSGVYLCGFQTETGSYSTKVAVVK